MFHVPCSIRFENSEMLMLNKYIQITYLFKIPKYVTVKLVTLIVIETRSIL